MVVWGILCRYILFSDQTVQYFTCCSRSSIKKSRGESCFCGTMLCADRRQFRVGKVGGPSRHSRLSNQHGSWNFVCTRKGNSSSLLKIGKPPLQQREKATEGMNCNTLALQYYNPTRKWYYYVEYCPKRCVAHGRFGEEGGVCCTMNVVLQSYYGSKESSQMG